MIMDMRTSLPGIYRTHAEDLPAPFEHYKMRDRGNDRFFRAGNHPPVHQGTEENDRAGTDTLVLDELAKGHEHVFPVIDPHDKDPAELTFRILHKIRFLFWYSYGLCGFISSMTR